MQPCSQSQSWLHQPSSDEILANPVSSQTQKRVGTNRWRPYICHNSNVFHIAKFFHKLVFLLGRKCPEFVFDWNVCQMADCILAWGNGKISELCMCSTLVTLSMFNIMKIWEHFFSKCFQIVNCYAVSVRFTKLAKYYQYHCQWSNKHNSTMNNTSGTLKYKEKHEIKHYPMYSFCEAHVMISTSTNYYHCTVYNAYTSNIGPCISVTTFIIGRNTVREFTVHQHTC